MAARNKWNPFSREWSRPILNNDARYVNVSYMKRELVNNSCIIVEKPISFGWRFQQRALNARTLVLSYTHPLNFHAMDLISILCRSVQSFPTTIRGENGSQCGGRKLSTIGGWQFDLCGASWIVRIPYDDGKCQQKMIENGEEIVDTRNTAEHEKNK